MLSFVGSILQSKNSRKLQRRKASVHKQLELWPVPQGPSQQKKIWQTLDHQQQINVVAALAALISKMVCTDKTNQTQEQSHER